ncbi:MAG: F0F1 ATP synthase subunit A [Bacillota bacterium]|nr:F0F1 ATP synthase subunit A [Bacillota bacterium]
MFHIGPIEVTSVMVTMTAITIGLTLLSYFATRNMSERPRGLQNFMEKCVEMLDNFIADIVGKEHSRQLFPFLATLFIFILVSNYSGLLPFAGSLPGLTAPTSVINVTAALAVCTFCMTHYSGVRAHGVHYLAHFTKPFIFMLPLLLIDEFVRPLSLTLRLYGNIYGEETVTHEIFNLVPLAVPLVMQGLSLLMGFVQAMVFVLLSSIYISGALGEGH